MNKNKEIPDNPNTHIYLYAKNHYKRTDIIEDLKIIVGNRSMCYPELITICDIVLVLTSVVEFHIQQGNFSYNFVDLISDLSPESFFKFENEDYKEYNYEMQVIKKFLSILKFVKISNIPGKLGKPDPNILPLNEENKK